MGMWHYFVLAWVSVFLLVAVIGNGATGASSDQLGASGDGASGSGKQTNPDLETGVEPLPKKLKAVNLFAWGFTKGIGKRQPPEERGAYSFVPSHPKVARQKGKGQVFFDNAVKENPAFSQWLVWDADSNTLHCSKCRENNTRTSKTERLTPFLKVSKNIQCGWML